MIVKEIEKITNMLKSKFTIGKHYRKYFLILKKKCERNYIIYDRNILLLQKFFKIHTGLFTTGILLNFYFAATNNTNGSNY
jgi:hypothetical protein